MWRSPSPSAWIHTGANADWEAGICSQWGLQFGWAVQMKSLEVEAGKTERHVTWAGCGHRLHNVPKHLPEMLGSFHSHGAWIAPCFLLSVTIAKALQVKIDLRSVLKLPETWYFLPGGIGVPLSIACQCKTEAAMFTKLTNGLQVKHWAICAAAFFFQALTSLLRLLAGECSVILSGLTYSNIMSFLIAFLEKICLQLHPVSLLRVLSTLTFSQGCIHHS